jgi:DNA-binding FrmR family transcriptional regulator
MYGYSENSGDYLNRLCRIEGQARGLQRTIEEDKYCIDILTQVSAATRALQWVALGLLDEHMSQCVAEAVTAGGDTAGAKIREASDAAAGWRVPDTHARPAAACEPGRQPKVPPLRTKVPTPRGYTLAWWRRQAERSSP